MIFIRFSYVFHVYVSDGVFKNMQCLPLDATIYIVPTPSSTTEITTASSNADTATVHKINTTSGFSTAAEILTEEGLDFTKEIIGVLSFQNYLLLYAHFW